MAARTRRRRRTGAAPRCTEDRAAETAKPAKKNDSSGQPARKSSQVFGTTAPATMPAAMRHGAHGRHRPGSLILSYKEQAKFKKAFGGAARSNDRCHCQDRVLAVPVAVKRRPRSHTRADTTTSCFAHARRPRHPGRRHPSHVDCCIGARPVLGASGDHDAYYSEAQGGTVGCTYIRTTTASMGLRTVVLQKVMVIIQRH